MHCAATNNVPAGCALALAALSSSDFDFIFIGSVTVTAGVRILRAGDVQELVNGFTWTTQNTDTDWIEAACEASDVGDDYEVRVEQTSSSGRGTFTGTLNTWQTINTTRTWQLQLTDNSPNSGTWTGTMRVRRIGDAGSEVSATIFLFVSIDI